MKKLAFMALASVLFSTAAHAQTVRLPFVGTQHFDFYDRVSTRGVCAVDVIRISRNGSVFIGPTGACPGIRAYYYNRGRGYYEGKYANNMRVKLPDGTVYYYQVKNGKIYRLNARKQLERNCNNSDYGNACVANLW